MSLEIQKLELIETPDAADLLAGFATGLGAIASIAGIIVVAT